MKCPFCEAENTKVLDSRETDEGKTTRRRRECISCDKRFTTYEKVETYTVRVVKSNKMREEFNRSKIMKGIKIACEKRPVSAEDIDRLVCEVENDIMGTGKKEVSGKFIGNLVMEKLKKLDDVAYIRFASVYKSFKCIDEFREELNKLN